MSTSSLGVSSSCLPSPPTPPTILLPSNFFPPAALSLCFCQEPLAVCGASTHLAALPSVSPAISSSLPSSGFRNFFSAAFCKQTSSGLYRYLSATMQNFKCATRTCWPGCHLCRRLVREVAPPPERRAQLHGSCETMSEEPFPKTPTLFCIAFRSHPLARHFPSVSAGVSPPSCPRPVTPLLHPLLSLVASLPGSPLLSPSVVSGSLWGLRCAPRRGATQQRQQQQQY